VWGHAEIMERMDTLIEKYSLGWHIYHKIINE
jgi:hypothetical protein